MWSFIVYLNYHMGSWPEYIAKVGRGQEEKQQGSSNAAGVIFGLRSQHLPPVLYCASAGKNRRR